MDTTERPSSLATLLTPRSVAVIGASDDPSRIGGRPIQYMRFGGFEGAIYPVNPRHTSVQGIRSYPDIASVDGDVDLAIVAVPARIVPEMLKACADKRVTSAVVFSAGFAEMNAEGQTAQAQISKIARERGIRVLGPNCLGLYNSAIGFFGTFSTTLEDRFPQPGPIGIVSQSGAYGSHQSLLASHRGMGVRYWVTTGNESDISVPEVIDWYADHPDVSVIVAYSEGLTNASALLRALDKARARHKPVIFMKVGTTEVGAEAVRSHTASLAGSDEVYDAVLRQFGAYRAHSTEEMLDVAYAASFGIFPGSRQVALMSISGGVGVQMADAAVKAGLDVAPMTDEAQATLKRDLPFAAPRNPIDITAQAFNNTELVSSNLQLILDDGRYDSVIAFFTYVASSKSMVEPILKALRVAKEGHPDCMLVLSIVGPDDVVRQYEEAGCPVFEDPTRAVRAVAALVHLRESFGRQARTPPDRSDAHPPLPPGPFSEDGTRRMLSRAGLPMANAGAIAQPGLDMVIGFRRDATFGPVVTVGFGGTLVEVLGDVSFRLPPFDADEARRMIGELRGFPVLDGTRGTSRYDLDALLDAAVAISSFAAAYGGDLDTAEINPLRVLHEGQGVMGLDVVVKLRARP